MLERLINFSINQRAFIISAMIALIIGGWYAISNLPIEAFPDVQDVQVQIVTQARGLAPEEVERKISLPIEREMNGVLRMSQLRSVSIFGLSVVTLTFQDNTDDFFARQQVLEKLQNVSLPPDAQPSLAPLSTAVGEIYRYVIEPAPGMTMEEVRELQDWVVRPNLRRVPGIADITSWGGAVKEYQVQVNPNLLRKFNVTLDQVSQALGSANENAGAGSLRRGDEGLVIRSMGLFQNTDDIKNIAIKSQNGKAILVKDIGEVVIGQKTRSGIVGFNKEDDVIEGVLLMTKGQNPSKVIADVKKAIEALQPKLPKGVRLKTIYDRTNLVGHTVHTVEENMIMGAILVIAILVIFLQSTIAAIIVASVIPLSLLFAFLFIHLRGISANLISLGAIDFGIIVDGAVVLVEALMVRIALGKVDGNTFHSTPSWRIQTLQNTAEEMGHPILFSKAIIILAFLPIFTFQRVEGKIFTPMTYTLSFAILGAVLLTFTLMPTLLSFAIRKYDLAEKHSPWMEKLQQRYEEFLNMNFARAIPILLLSVGLLIGSLLLGTRLGSEFLPKLDEGNIWLTIDLPVATNLYKSKEIERDIRSILKSYPEVSNVITHVGRPDDGTDPKGPNHMEILADLTPHDTWRFSNKEALITDMTRKIKTIPGIQTNFSQVIEDNVEESISGVKGEIAIKIFGPDLNILEDKAEQVTSIIKKIPGSADVAAIKVGGQSEVDIELNKDLMARYGIQTTDVNNTIKTALAGSAATVMFYGERQFDVTVRLKKEMRDAIDDIAEIPVVIPNTTNTIPLGSLATINVKQGPARINRESGGRFVAIKSNLSGRDQGDRKSVV